MGFLEPFLSDDYSFKTDANKNEDYYCYDKKIYAPGSGIIVTLKNNLRENKPGEMPKTSGNHVIIDHGNGEYSILSHFKYKTIVVSNALFKNRKKNKVNVFSDYYM